jgi:hypothetical protein
MPKTTNLGLELTTDDSVKFKDWREAINGVGEGENKSNMQIIDEFAGQIKGMLGDDGKLKSELLPSFVFGGMRFVTSISEPMTTAELRDRFEEFIDANGGTMRGCYAITTTFLTITLSEGDAFVGAEEREFLDPERPGSDIVDLEQHDWIIAVDDNGTTWAVINNTYERATTNYAGIVQLATEQNGIDGTSNTLAMTPKATAAAINAAINEILGDIDTALSNILGV